MNIIIEGTDGVGKTTLVQKLKEYYKTDSLRCTYKDPKNASFYSTLLDKTNCIYDRLFLSEIVYPTLFNRKCQLRWTEVLALLEKCKHNKIKIFILDTDTDEVLTRINNRGQEHPLIIENIDMLRTEFKKIADLFSIEIIDTSKISFEEIVRKVDKYNE